MQKGGIGLDPTERKKTEIEQRKSDLQAMLVEMAEEPVELWKYREAVQEEFRISELLHEDRQSNEPEHLQ